MKIPRCLGISALALVVACLAAPSAAFAEANYGDGSSGSVIGGSGGYTWLNQYVTQRGCSGTEPEINSLIKAPPGVDPASYWNNGRLFEQRRQKSAEGVLSVAHCHYDLKLAWGVLPLAAPIQTGGLAGGTVTLQAQMFTALDANNVPITPAPISIGTTDLGGVPAPLVRESLATPWPTVSYTLVPQRTLDRVAWTVSGSCTVPNPTGATISFQLTSKTCLNVSATAYWTEKMLQVGSDGSRKYAVLTGSGLTTCALDGLSCTDKSWMNATITANELRAVFTDGEAQVSPGATSPNGDPIPTLTSSSSSTGYQYSASLGFQYGSEEMPKCAVNAVCPKAGEATKPAAKPAPQPAPLNTQSASSRSSGGSDNSGFDSKLGGLGIGLLLVAGLAVGGFMFFGRRHRL